MTTASTNDENNRAEPPLWSIGVAVVIILLAPLVLYSWAPTDLYGKGILHFQRGNSTFKFAIQRQAGRLKTIPVYLIRTVLS